MIEMYRFFLDDSNDSIIQVMTQEISKNYSKMILLLCNLGMNTTTNTSFNQSQIAQLWVSFKSIITKLNEMMTSKRSEQLREQCIRLLEEEILFGFPNTTVTTDPRLARRNDPRLNRGGATAASTVTGATGASSQVVGGTADEIPAHHPFISKTDIQKEAEEYFSKIILWTNKGASQGITFSPHLISVMAQVIGSIGSMRPACSANAAQLITFLISNKATIINQMSKNDKENLLRSTHRLVRATSVYAADPEGQMQKLKGLISQLESMTMVNVTEESESGSSSAIIGNKRDASSMLEDSGVIDDGDEKPEVKRAKIKAAIEEAEKNKEIQLSKALDNSSGGAGVGGSMIIDSVFLQSVSETEFTELSSDLVSFHTLSINFGHKLVNIQPQTNKQGSFDMNFTCQAIPINDGQSYSDLSTFLLVKIIENYTQVMRKDVQTQQYYSKLLIRVAMNLMKATMENAHCNYQVPIINSWGYDAPREHRDLIPVVINLPRSLWLFLSFCFQHIEYSSYQIMNDLSIPEGTDAASHNFGTKIQLLTTLCKKLYADSFLLGDTQSTLSPQQQQLQQQLYEAIVLTSLARIVQIIYLREYAANFLLQLPKIPKSCLSFLIILTLSSSKMQSKDTNAHIKNNIRNESLFLLGKIILESRDQEIAQQTLTYLLWYSIHDEIELRYRIIGLFVSDIYKQHKWVDEMIEQFVLHSIIGIFSKGYFEQYQQQNPSEDAKPLRLEEEEGKGNRLFSLFPQLSSYQNGEQFHGNYQHFFQLHSTLTKTDRSELFKKINHFLQKFAIEENGFLQIYAEIYVVCKTISASKHAEPKQKLSVKQEGGSDVAPIIIEDDGMNEITPQELASIVDEITTTFNSIIPAIAQHVKDDSLIFDILTSSSIGYTASIQPLIKHTLSLLTADLAIPVQSRLLERVEEYYATFYHQESFTIYIFTQNGEGKSAEEEAEEEAGISCYGLLINGFSLDIIEMILPKLIKYYGENQPEKLNLYFNKLIKCRPPAMTKTNLLVFLHRLKLEVYDIKAKAVLEAIKLCMNNSEVIKETLQILQNDEIPPYAIMRTAILASQSFNDIKKFVIQETIPTLLKKNVWTIAPKVWEGVIFGIKNLIPTNTATTSAATVAANAKLTEPMFRALLSIPGKQLQAVLKVATNIKPLLSQFYQSSLTNEEREAYFQEKDQDKNKLFGEFSS